MRIAITANGPGELAGWVRPLIRRLYARAPQTEIHLFLVPDDYATGREAAFARRHFPSAHVYDPPTYLRVALGQRVDGLPDRVDVVHYLGGDLMHAMRVRGRLRAAATAYKFSTRRYAQRWERVYAVDGKNVEVLRAGNVPAERIECVGNLAIDGALLEAQAPLEDGAPVDGILIMPGSRSYEVQNLVPFFFTMALRALRERPQLPIAFGISPFTEEADVARAVERAGDPRMWAERGTLVRSERGIELVSLDGAVRIPVLRNVLAAAKRARLAVTIPGTKCIELAVLGVPTVAITPLNAPEKIAFNGPLTYLNRLPFVGVPLKRAVVTRIAARFLYHTQPNIDAGASIVDERHGTLTPGRVARVALERYDDSAWLARSKTQLGSLYADHVGAADRMAESLLKLASC
ncbi:MAG: hypothetical protein M3R51_04700 [Candidatus Eremiobacteraeota bacterium]|nr:hypothetical protein [Candidatus Eremiobacteraeota bacterium]